MTRLRKRAALTTTLLMALSTAGAHGEVAPQSAAATVAREGERYWNHVVERSMYMRMVLGLPIESIDYTTAADAERSAAFARSLLQRLEEVDVAALSHAAVLDLEVMRWQARSIADAAQFYWYGFEVTPYPSPLPQLQQVMSTRPLSSIDDRALYLRLLGDGVAFIDSVQARLRGQARQGIRVPLQELDTVIPFVSSMIGDGPGNLFSVHPDRLDDVDADESDAFLAQMDGYIADSDRALQEIVDLLDGAAYRGASPVGVGAWQLPGGEDWYRYQVRQHTTLDITPEEVHAIGLEEVARVNATMATLRDDLGHEGTKAEFHQFLRTDPQFFPDTARQIHDRLMGYAAEMEGKIDSMFLRRPAAPYGVKRLEPEREPRMTFGTYEVPTAAEPTGYYRYNGSDLDQRSMLFLQALTYHELIPGHHFHINLQSENPGLADFRRYSFFGAFTEGWGDYASSLGVEAGLYDDPYGRQSMDIFISVRLVVDTGMNHLRWPRARATAFMLDHVLESETQIASETLRYSVDMPGQALAYKTGARRFWDLRRRAEEALGDRFDLARFHDAILSYGALPMQVLEQHVDWFIEQEQAG